MVHPRVGGGTAVTAARITSPDRFRGLRWQQPIASDAGARIRHGQRFHPQGQKAGDRRVPSSFRGRGGPSVSGRDRSALVHIGSHWWQPVAFGIPWRRRHLRRFRGRYRGTALFG